LPTEPATALAPATPTEPGSYSAVLAVMTVVPVKSFVVQAEALITGNAVKIIAATTKSAKCLFI